VLAAAIMVHAFVRPAEPTPAPAVGVAAIEVHRIEAQIDAEVARRVDAAVTSAVARSEARQAKKAGEMVEAMRRDVDFQRRADRVAFEEVFTVMQKRYANLQLASLEGDRP